MKRLLAYTGLWASVAVTAFAVVYVGLALASAVSASAAWVGSRSITSPFYTAFEHHQGCGKPSGHVTRGYYGAYHETFQHCEMSFSRVFVTEFGRSTATPQPTHTPLPPTPPPTSTAIPTATPTATDMPTISPTWAVTPVPIADPLPTQTRAPDHRAGCGSGDSSACAAYLVDLINAERAQYGYAPLSLDSVLTNGSGSCVGAVGHALHMANDLHTIAHDQFPADVCSGPYNAKGENVGVSAYGSLLADVDTIHSQMQAEPFSPGCSDNHHCNWMSPAFTRVGIAIVPGIFQGYTAHYESEEYSN